MAKTKKEKALKIGVLKPDNIGDAVLASPFIFELRKKYHKAVITGILSPAGARVLEGLGVFDSVLIVNAEWLKYKKTSWCRRWGSAALILQAVNKEKFDMLIGMRYRDRLSSLILSCAKAGKKIGYAVGGAGFGITDKVNLPPAGLHETKKNALLLKHLGIKSGSKMKFGVSTSPEAKKNMKALLEKGKIKKYIVIHPVSGHISKDYKKYEAVSKALSKKFQIVIVGAKEDKAAREILGNNIYNFTGLLTIKEMGELIKGARLVIGNDSAAVHMAFALGVKTLTVFSGAARYEEWGTVGNKAYLMVKETECRGCELAVCNRKGECLDIAPEAVIKTALDIINGKINKKIIKTK